LSPPAIQFLSWISLGLLLVGAFDPLEGSVAVAIGAVLAASAAAAQASHHLRLLLSAALLTLVGVAAMWAMSAAGGIGGHTGRSYWWGLLLVPYPEGWVMALTGAFRLIRRRTDRE
jgi:hypothetical protein